MHWMGDTLKMWSQNGGIYKNEWSGCDGLCYLNVTGFGFAFECDETQHSPINYGNKLAQQTGVTANLFEIDFGVRYVDDTDEGSYLTMDVMHTNANQSDANLPKDCPGKLFTQSCKLWPALIRYPVVVANTSSESSVSLGEFKPYPNLTANYADLHPFSLEKQQQTG